MLAGSILAATLAVLFSMVVGAAGNNDTPCGSPGNPSTLQIHMQDSWGDGWGGHSMTIYDCVGNVLLDDVHLANGHSGTQLVCSHSVLEGFIVQVDSAGYFYTHDVSWQIFNVSDGGAATDDVALIEGGAPFLGSVGTCPNPACEPGTTRLELYDTYGDGWNDNIVTVATCDGETLTSDTLGHGLHHADVCLPAQDGYVMQVGGGKWMAEVSWRLVDVDSSDVLLTGHAPFNGYVGCDTSPCRHGTVHRTDSNVGGHSNGNIRVRILDCTGHSIDDFDVQADGMVDFCIPLSNEGFVVLVEGSHDEVWAHEVAWSMEVNGSTVLGGGMPFVGDVGCPAGEVQDTSCDDDNSVRLEMFDTTGDGWHGATIEVKQCDGSSLPGLPSSFTMSNGQYAAAGICLPRRQGYIVEVTRSWYHTEVLWRIVDALAGNGGHVMLSGHSPFVGSVGCPNRACADLDFRMFDTFGDGWNSHDLNVFDCQGNSILSGITLLTGSVGFADACVPELNGYVFHVGGGTYPEEVQWELLNTTSGIVMFQGGAPFVGSIGCGSTGGNMACPVGTVRIEMYDSYGDGWNGATLDVTSCNGTMLTAGLTMGGGLLIDHADACIPGLSNGNVGFHVTVNGGLFNQDIGWRLVELTGDGREQQLLDGHAPYDGYYGCVTSSPSKSPSQSSWPSPSDTSALSSSPTPLSTTGWVGLVTIEIAALVDSNMTASDFDSSARSAFVDGVSSTLRYYHVIVEPVDVRIISVSAANKAAGRLRVAYEIRVQADVAASAVRTVASSSFMATLSSEVNAAMVNNGLPYAIGRVEQTATAVINPSPSPQDGEDMNGTDDSSDVNGGAVALGVILGGGSVMVLAVAYRKQKLKPTTYVARVAPPPIHLSSLEEPARGGEEGDLELTTAGSVILRDAEQIGPIREPTSRSRVSQDSGQGGKIPLEDEDNGIIELEPIYSLQVEGGH